jgi:hypothetical protein
MPKGFMEITFGGHGSRLYLAGTQFVEKRWTEERDFDAAAGRQPNAHAACIKVRLSEEALMQETAPPNEGMQELVRCQVRKIARQGELGFKNFPIEAYLAPISKIGCEREVYVTVDGFGGVLALAVPAPGNIRKGSAAYLATKMAVRIFGRGSEHPFGTDLEQFLQYCRRNGTRVKVERELKEN